jgi:hypothetical protein
MAASRSYDTGIQPALTWLSDGTCYWPGCPERVVRLIDGEYKLALQIAHICALNPGGPRYDDEMPEPSRNDFANLILLCYVHHRTIDGRQWQNYPVSLLREWKNDRESGRNVALRTLRDMTEDRLQVLITRAISDRDNQIQQTLSRLETNDAEAASLLRELTDEIAELRGRGSLLDPDAVSILDSAAHRLGHLQDTTPGLRDAAERLAHLQDTVYLLDNLASRIEQAANRMGEY